MWQPGFEYEHKEKAMLKGYHRSCCVYSFYHRGSRQNPGLVLGLDKGGSCEGIVFTIHPEKTPQTLKYLREREQVTSVYKEMQLTVFNAKQEVLSAIGYVVKRTHEQYAGTLIRDEKISLIQNNHGHSGYNKDYILQSYATLKKLDIKDNELEILAKALKT